MRHADQFTSGILATKKTPGQLIWLFVALSAISYTAVNAQCIVDPCTEFLDGCIGELNWGRVCCDCETGLEGLCGLTGGCDVGDIPVVTPSPMTPSPITWLTFEPTPSATRAPISPPIVDPTTAPTTPEPTPSPIIPSTITTLPPTDEQPTTATVEPTSAPATPTTPQPRSSTTTAAPVDAEEPATTPVPTPADELETRSPITPENDDSDSNDDSDDDDVEAGDVTTFSVTASAYDTRSGEDSGDVGCGESGCLPSLTRDGISDNDLESRWSCAKEIVPDGGQCEIEFTFDSPQDLLDVQVAFWKGNERSRTLKVSINGDNIGEFDSTPDSVYTFLGIEEEDVNSVTLESTGIDEDEWISLLEVRFMVEV